MAEVVFQPQSPFVVDSFKSCEGLGRIAIMEGATVVMLGKVVETVFDDGKVETAAPAAGAKGAPAAKGGAAPAGGAKPPAAAKAGGAAPAAAKGGAKK